MTVRSALRAVRQLGPWRVVSLANGDLLVQPIGRRRPGEKHGVITRMYLASCLETVLKPTAAMKRSKRRDKP